jgi:hypothetical protein
MERSNAVIRDGPSPLTKNSSRTVERLTVMLAFDTSNQRRGEFFGLDCIIHHCKRLLKKLLVKVRYGMYLLFLYAALDKMSVNLSLHFNRETKSALLYRSRSLTISKMSTALFSP